MNVSTPLTREQIIQSIALNSPIEEVQGPNVDKLVELIQSKGSTGIHFDWQPSAVTLTPDQRAAEVLKWQDQINEYEALPVETKLRLQIRDTYITLHQCFDEGKIDVRKMVNDEYTVQELLGKLSGIFSRLDVALMTLGNWVDRDVKEKLYEERRKKENLPKLIESITPENRHEEVDWGPAQGNEVI